MKDMFNRSEFKFILGLTMLFLAVVIIRTAWMCDDAYTSFRVMGNFLQWGRLTFNLDERVFPVTHPLWFFLLLIPYYLTRDAYYTTLLISFIISLLAVYLVVFKIARSNLAGLVALVILIFSKAFIDFSTSGLENPLTYLILASYFWLYFTRENCRQKLFYLSLLAGLGMFNRLDTGLFYLPSLFDVFWRLRKDHPWFPLLAGLLPIIFWLIFSTFYFGFPFPNTAYAKLQTGISQTELFAQGGYYLLNSLSLDPLTLTIIVFVVGLSFMKGNSSLTPASYGALLYLYYILYIGGDFMSGRFLAAVLFTSVIILVRASLFEALQIFLLIAVIILGLSAPFPTVLNNANYGLNRNDLFDNKGIADERGFYYPKFGFLNTFRSATPNSLVWNGWKEPIMDKVTSVEAGVDFLGSLGLQAKPNVHLVDIYALADPLLARLPAAPDPNWRIGHFIRVMPEGYLETLKTGKNQIKDKNIALYYDKLSFITRGNLFDIDRLKEIIKFNLGKYNYLINLRYNHELSLSPESKTNISK
ncbi:MAG: hypothetical protein ABIH50_01380 [bacterium]